MQNQRSIANSDINFLVYSSSFGMMMPGRRSPIDPDERYKYGFQGQEVDDEIKGYDNSLNYTFRMHDPRLGRFFALDPLASDYPHNSPYAFSENRVIDAVELEGLEAKLLSTGEWSPLCTTSDVFYVNSNDVQSSSSFSSVRGDNSEERSMMQATGWINKAMQSNTNFTPPAAVNLHIDSRVIVDSKSEPSVAHIKGKNYLKVESKVTIIIVTYDYHGNISNINKTVSTKTTYQELKGITSERFAFKTNGVFKTETSKTELSFEFSSDFMGQTNAFNNINRTFNNKTMMNDISSDLKINSESLNNFWDIATDIWGNINDATKEMEKKAEGDYSPSSSPSPSQPRIK